MIESAMNGRRKDTACRNLIEVRDLKKYFSTRDGLLHAVDGISFDVLEGETLGIVGESGCGKSTAGRLLLRLLEPTSGSVKFDGTDLGSLSESEMRIQRRRMQMVFQDPFASLNPRQSVADTVMEPLTIYGIGGRKERMQKTLELLDLVGLSRRLYNVYPHELDGGRRQRVGIARALALSPRFIVCDEPVSALDVSIQAQILNLLQDLQEKLGLTLLFISHNLSVVKHVSSRIAVMYLGKIVETAYPEDLFSNPLHPYTQALLSAIPIPKFGADEPAYILEGDVPNAIGLKASCRFAGRCRLASQECQESEPPLEGRKGHDAHQVACFKA